MSKNIAEVGAKMKVHKVPGFNSDNLGFYEFTPSEWSIKVAEIFGYKPYIIERYVRMFGQSETIELLKFNEVPPPISFRINTLKFKGDPKRLLSILKEKGYNFRSSEYCELGYILDEPGLNKIYNNLEDIKIYLSQDEMDASVKSIKGHPGPNIEVNNDTQGIYINANSAESQREMGKKDLKELVMKEKRKLSEKKDFTRDPRILEALDWGKITTTTNNIQNNTQNNTQNNNNLENMGNGDSGPNLSKNRKKHKNIDNSLGNNNDLQHREDNIIKQTGSLKIVKNTKLLKVFTKYTQKQVASLGSTDEYLRGYYYIQGLASMIPPIFLNPLLNEIVIDMAAAPGGKTTELAQLMNNTGYIIAIEKSRARINSLLMNLRRCGVKNTIVIKSDAKDLSKLRIHPDKILLDAPCSGEGVIREDPTRKFKKDPEHMVKYMKDQKELLLNGLKILKPGGLLLYSTCSIAPEENEFIIQELLNEYKNFEVIPVNDDYGVPGFTNIFGLKLSEQLNNARRYYPHIHNTIGFFYCLLKKK